MTAVTDPVSCNVKTERQDIWRDRFEVCGERREEREVGPVYIHTLELHRSGGIAWYPGKIVKSSITV